MEKRELIRKEILYYIEKNSRADLAELAVLLGTDEVTRCQRNCRHGEGQSNLWISYADRLGQSRSRTGDSVDRSAYDATEKSGI